MTSQLPPCGCQQQMEVLWKDVWREQDEWRRQVFSTASLRDGETPLTRKSDVFVVLASANRMRGCASCREAFTYAFAMPATWWTEYSRRANGYFGSKTARESDEKGRQQIGASNTWARFQVKKLDSTGTMSYEWYKTNVFVRWLAATRQTIIILFDVPPTLRARIPSPLMDDLRRDDLRDPFWIHARLVEEVVSLQNESVWTARTYVRTMEKARTPADEPNPDFARLHDIARHAIHVSETLAVGVKTIGCILRAHTAFDEEREQDEQEEAVAQSQNEKSAFKAVHEKLLFLEHMMEGLESRAASNKDRLNNEMQLAFHMVTQCNAELSLQMGRSMRSDSAAMKTIAFLTLAFLPATFVSAVFSTSFFNYDAETGWTMSGHMWVFWVVAVPLTILTTGMWLWWQHARGW